MMKEITIQMQKNGVQMNGKIQIRHGRGKAIKCPDCGEKMRKVYMRSSDLPLFAGYGSCRCSDPGVKGL
jgi:hypothetical protein